MRKHELADSMLRVGGRFLGWLGAGFQAYGDFRDLCTTAYYARKFKRCGDGLRVVFPVRINHPGCVSVGKGVRIQEYVQIRLTLEYMHTGQRFDPEVVIGDYVFLNTSARLSAVNRIVFGDRVIIAPNSYIADNGHDYRDVSVPIIQNPLLVGEIHIGDGTWIGSHACILGDLRIGKHCVIGAHTVVRHSIPDYCVVAGAPARIVKRYDPDTGTWRPTDRDGDFK